MNFKIHVIEKGLELNSILAGAVPLSKTTHPVHKYAINMEELDFIPFNIDNLLEHAKEVVTDSVFEFGVIPEVNYYIVDDTDRETVVGKTMKSLLDIHSESVTCFHHTTDATIEFNSIVNKVVYKRHTASLMELLKTYMNDKGLRKLRVYAHPHQSIRLDTSFRPDDQLEFQLLPPGKKLTSLEVWECLLDMTSNKITTFSDNGKVITWESSHES